MALTREGRDGAGAADEGTPVRAPPTPGLGANRQSPMKGPPVGLVRQTVTTDGRGWSP
jgi:hypothetical protein